MMKFLLHHFLRSAVAAGPERVAVVDGERQLTYEELESRSNKLANFLRDVAGVGRGDRVGLYLDKSAESIVAIYGILKAGAVYVPLDPQAPVRRVAYIARDCDMRVLMTAKEKATSWVRLVENGAPIKLFVVLNGSGGAVDVAPGVRAVDLGEIDETAGTPPTTSTISHDLAYILYTSGSTGDPKGVTLSHRNGIAFVDWAADEFAVTSDDRLSSHAPLHFDLSIFDVFAAARAGATLVLVPPRISVFPVEVARFIENGQITTWYSVPSVLSLLVQKGALTSGDFPRLRTILFAGEVFPTKYLRQLMTLLPHVRFANLYGPTETNVCTWYDVPPLSADQTEDIPIGKAIADVEVFAVTDEGAVAQAGEAGELHVRGPTVMQGYWGDEERTRRSLLVNPVAPEKGDLVYRTGDLVRQDDEGNYRFLGRRDTQVKSRGYRIELGEVESALYSNPSVIECAVLAMPDELITNRLVGCVVAQDDIDTGALVRFCSERIPKYMIPHDFHFRGALPKTSTGKIDRQALMNDVRRSTGAGFDAYEVRTQDVSS